MKIAWKPQPKQARALVSDADEILYGGARGGGKTDCGQAWLTYDHKHPKYRALVIRKNYTDLSDWIDRAKNMFAPIGAKFVGEHFILPAGGIIRTGHLKDEDAYTKYQGHEYQRVLIEELSHIARQKDYEKLISCCRSTFEDLPAQVFNTTNPDEPGLDWIRDRWNIPEEPDFEQTYENFIEVEVAGKKIRRKLAFIPARIEDNPALTEKDPAYLAFLESLKKNDPSLYDAWRMGYWRGYQAEGTYYREQIVRAEADGRITGVPYDEFADVYTWCDLGIADSFAIGYFQMIGKEWHMIDYDELEGESLGSAIATMRRKPYRYAEHYAPHDIEVRELGTGKTRLEIAAENGVKYNIAPRLDVADGINAVRMRFSTLWIDKEKCKLFLKRIRNYRKEFDDKRGMWKDKPLHDNASHAADMLRYWAVTPIRGVDKDLEERIWHNRTKGPMFK